MFARLTPLRRRRRVKPVALSESTRTRPVPRAALLAMTNVPPRTNVPPV